MVLPVTHVHPQMERAMPAFTPQPHSVTAFCLVLISCSAEGRRLSWPTHKGLSPTRRRVLTKCDTAVCSCTHHHYH